MIKVVNQYKTGVGEYIGRGNPLGNPFTHQQGTLAKTIVATREEAVTRYRTWLIEQIQENNPAVVRELLRLLEIAKHGDLYLRCFCAPKACHGDVIKECLEHFLNNP